MPRHKYNAKKIENSFGRFDSKKEFSRFMVLKQLQDEGIISGLQRQVPYELIPKQKLVYPRVDKSGRRQNVEHALKYYADFVYERDGRMVVEDVKGMRTAEYKLKRKLMLYIFGIQIKEV